MIVSRDPMYVTFPVSQREFLQGPGRRKSARQREQALTVRIRFSDGSTYDQTGKINFVDVTVDRATDTVLVRATVPNPNGTLIDGQLVRVAVEADKPEEKVLVPQSALVADQQGIYVFLVVDGKAAIRRVKLGGESGPYVIVEDGLKGGEQVVVQGMESLRAGVAGRRPARHRRRSAGAEPMFSAIFIDRPRLATVIAIVTTIAGLLSLLVIPIAQYPDIVPPQVSVTTTYPGASAAVVEATDRAADRKPGRRRRQDDLHEERQRQ